MSKYENESNADIALTDEEAKRNLKTSEKHEIYNLIKDLSKETKELKVNGKSVDNQVKLGEYIVNHLNLKGVTISQPKVTKLLKEAGLRDGCKYYLNKVKKRVESKPTDKVKIDAFAKQLRPFQIEFVKITDTYCFLLLVDVFAHHIEELLWSNLSYGIYSIIGDSRNNLFVLFKDKASMKDLEDAISRSKKIKTQYITMSSKKEESYGDSSDDSTEDTPESE